MPADASPVLIRFFLRVLRARAWIATAFLLLTAAGLYGALQLPDDSAIDRLVVTGDPVARATAEFQRVFPEGAQALLMLESADPLSNASLRAAQALERQLDDVPHVTAHSLLTLYLHGSTTGTLGPAESERVRAFAAGTPLFRRAGLLGDGYLGIAVELRVGTPEERNVALAAIDGLARSASAPGAAFTAVRCVGSPWLDAWLEKHTGAATRTYMPLFGLFLLGLVLVVFRSWRALGAITFTLAAVVSIAVGLAWPIGWAHTIVSSLVPLTVMITTTATLVYIHARYVEPGDSSEPLAHHASALANKFLPCTASIFAAAVGFGALAVSQIRPVREMGLWTASGLIVAWVGCFTLFPALQSLMRTPTRSERAVLGEWFPGLVQRLVPATRRYRWPLVIAAVVLMLCGAAALFGVPGLLGPLKLETDGISYVDANARIAKDTRRFEASNGLDVAELWLQTRPGHALDPDFLQAVERLTLQFERDPRITAVDGPTSILRWARYVQSGSDRLPDDPAAWPTLAADLEQILLSEPGARDFVDVANLASVRVSIRGRERLFGDPGSLGRFVEKTWAAAQSSDPALRDVRGLVVGQGVLSARISGHLLPTLTESFAITAGVIFLAFLVVFRSATARLMTMIPSLFAILSVFLLMRLTGIPLNIATTLIASTILGATENDQIHFFYHYQEGQPADGTAGALRHAMVVAGRPILFATLINASGFLALILSDLPPMRQFGIVTSSAFVLALIADFTALPAALWILSKRSGQ